MTNSLKSGDVVLVDLGMAAKVRPCVVFAPRPDSQRSLAIVAPLTSESRGGDAEIAFPKPAWLNQACVLNLAGMLGVERVRILRRLGPFPADKFREAKAVLAKFLELKNPPAHPAA